MGRAPCCDKANVKKGPWSPEEDAKLKAYIEKYGTGGNWIALPQKIGLKRCGKSCRLRWLNYLRPNIKHGGFSEEEDNIICSLYISIGSRWSIIAAQLPGRTDNDIKNYWNTRLKKKLLGRRKQSNATRNFSSTDNIRDASGSEDSAHPPALSNSALERLQLHMQLQRLNSPLSFYNNPALWPKMINHNLQLSSENIYPNHQIQIDPASDIINLNPENDPNVSSSFYVPALDAVLINGSSVNLGMEQIQPGVVSSLLAQNDHHMDGMFGNYGKLSGGNEFVSQENREHQMMPDFDCFKGFLDDSTSWDDSSSPVDHVHGGGGIMFQGYEAGYNNL